MKYKALKLHDTHTHAVETGKQWTVAIGNRYFPDRMFDTETEAKLDAIRQSAHWHRIQIEVCRDAWRYLKVMPT